MKTIGFIGSYDKTDFIIYIAKILTMLGKRILVIDNTLMQKARYIVPVINPTKAYVTEFEKIDVAVGFNNFDEIKKYLGLEDRQDFEYDIALIDIDNVESFEKYDIKHCEKKYFVTSFDLCSLKRGLEILVGISEPIRLTKILFAKDMLKEEDEYLNYLALDSKVTWDDTYKIYMPLDVNDQQAIIENQRMSRIGIRKLSAQYREGLKYVTQDIASDILPQSIKKIFKNLERDV